MTSMEKNNNYNAPNIEVIDIEIEGGFCMSGNQIMREQQKRTGKNFFHRLWIAGVFSSIKDAPE